MADTQLHETDSEEQKDWQSDTDAAKNADEKAVAATDGAAAATGDDED